MIALSRSRSSAFVLALALGVATLGCGGGKASSKGAKEAKPAAVAAQPAAALVTASGAPEYVYQYNPVGLRDPYRSPLNDAAIQQAGAGRSLCSDPLCQWELGQLTLVVVVTGDASPIAMVEDPSGRGHIVRRNTKIGKQDGRVAQILRDAVIVTEYWLSPDGKTKPNPRSMKLKEDVASVPPVDMLTGQPFNE